MEEAPIRVVVVDDAPRTVENLKKLLGFEQDIQVVGTALSAEKGIEVLRRTGPDVLVMDVNLSDLDGIQTTARLSREMPTLGVILISVQEDREYFRQAMQAGAREYLIKPFSADELVDAVRRVHGREQGRRQAPVEPPPKPARKQPAPEAQKSPEPPPPAAVETPAWLPAAPEVAPEPEPEAPAAREPATPPPAPGVAPEPPTPAPPPAPEPEPQVLLPPPAPAPPAPQPPAAVAPPPPTILGAEDSIDAGPLTTMLPTVGETPAMKRKSQIGEVTAIYSGKGGVGKSMIAVNLATALIRELEEDVCLVDLDLQFGDSAVLLGLDPPGSLADVAKAFPNIDAPLLGSFMPQAAGGVRVLSSPLSPELADLVRPEHVRKSLEILKAAFDHVIVDMAAHLNDVTLEALEAADRVLMVTDLNVPAIKDAKLAFKLFETLGIPRERIHLVLNRSDAPSNVTIAQLEANLRCPVAVAIPSEGKTVLQSLHKAVPFVELFPDSEIARKVRDLVGCLVPLADARRAGPKKAGRRRFWARTGAG